MAKTIAMCLKIRWPDVTVVEARDGASGSKMAGEESPDIIVLDVGLPDMEGFEVCRDIRRWSDTPIIMLTVRDEESDIVRGLELGADDYITKPFRYIEFIARVQAALRRAEKGPLGTAEEPFNSGEMTVDFSHRAVSLAGKPVKLTSTEYNLLCYLVRNAGKVLTHKNLLSQVWGEEYTDAVDYLKVHIQRLRQKLNDDAKEPRLIATEWGVGYRFIPQQAKPRPQVP